MSDTEKAALERRIDELCAEVEAVKHDLSIFSGRIVELNAENTKLRGQYEAVIDDYRSEVAKLRELVRDYELLTATLCNERECDGCPFDGTEQIVCEHMRLQTCLSELGVEVPDGEI